MLSKLPFIILAKVKQSEAVKQLPYAAFWILFFISLIACKKESSNRVPVVTFVYPQGEWPAYNREGEKIVIRIQDDQHIQQARIGWVNENFVSLNNPTWIAVNSCDTLINYWLNAKNIPAGKAYIQIRVDDGEHTKLKYQPVKVSEPIEAGQQIIFGYNKGQNGMLLSFDTASTQPEEWLTTLFPIYRIEGLADKDLLAIMPENKNFAEVWSVKNAILLWRQEASLPEPEFSDCYLDEEGVLLSDLNGDMRLYHLRTGITQLTAKLEAVYRISAVAFDHNYLFAAARDIQTDKKWLYLFFRASGTLYKRFELDYLPIDMIAVAKDQSVVLFSADAQATQILYFNANTESFQLKNTLSNFELQGSVIRQDDYYFLHSKTEVKRWSFTTNTTTLIAKGNNINGLATSNAGAFVFYLDGDFLGIIHPDAQYVVHNIHEPLTLITTISN